MEGRFLRESWPLFVMAAAVLFLSVAAMALIEGSLTGPPEVHGHDCHTVE